MALSAAATYAPRNVRVNCVAPGLTHTPMTARITGTPAALLRRRGCRPACRSLLGLPAAPYHANRRFLLPPEPLSAAMRRKEHG